MRRLGSGPAHVWGVGAGFTRYPMMPSMMVPGSTGKVIGRPSPWSPGVGFSSGVGDVVVGSGEGVSVDGFVAGSLVAGAGDGLVVGVAETEVVADGEDLTVGLRLGLREASGEDPISAVTFGAGASPKSEMIVVVMTSPRGFSPSEK
jgi:hypothetical protein